MIAHTWERGCCGKWAFKKYKWDDSNLILKFWAKIEYFALVWLILPGHGWSHIGVFKTEPTQYENYNPNHPKLKITFGSDVFELIFDPISHDLEKHKRNTN